MIIRKLIGVSFIFFVLFSCKSAPKQLEASNPPAPVPEAEPVVVVTNQVEPQEEVVVLEPDVNAIYFAFDDYSIEPRYLLGGSEQDFFTNHINYLKSRENIKVILEGHADAIGPKEYNLDLSEKRVLSVFDYLIKNGVSEAKLDVDFFGEEELIVDEGSSKEEQWENRRVEFNYLD